MINKQSLTFLALLFAGSFLLSSCSKEDKVARNLEGSWEVESVDGDGEETSDDGEKSGSGKTTSITIRKSGNGDFHFNDDNTGSYTLRVKIKVEVDSTVEVLTTTTKTGSFEWENDAKTVSIDYDNGPEVTLNVENKNGNWVVKGQDLKAPGSFFMKNSLMVNNQHLNLDLEVTHSMKLEK